MQNYAQIGDIDNYSLLYITYLSFQLLRNHRILQHIISSADVLHYQVIENRFT